jgi:hypothetical protein
MMKARKWSFISPRGSQRHKAAIGDLETKVLPCRRPKWWKLLQSVIETVIEKGTNFSWLLEQSLRSDSEEWEGEKPAASISIEDNIT